MYVPCSIMLYFMPLLISNHLDVDKRSGFFTLVVCLVHGDCCCSVAQPHVAVGKSAVRDYGIS